MTSITSNTGHRSLKFRCMFFSIEYENHMVQQKILKNTESNNTEISEKIIRKNSRIENTKKTNKKIENKLVKNNIKIQNRKLNQKNTNSRKLNNMKKILNIVEQIIRIGSALSGLLPMRPRLIKTVMLCA